MKRFIFGERANASACSLLNAELLAELWNGFCFRCGTLDIESTTDEFIFTVGSAPVLAPEDGEEYKINVNENGISVCGRNKETLMRGFFDMAARIEAEDLTEKKEFFIGCGVIGGKYKIGLRMAHLCLFPETGLLELKKRIRLLAALRYTHVIIEFWGTLRLKCLPELGWRGASFSPEEIAPVIREARDLGLEPVPMLNHLGHAPFSRIRSGKHVVLDQNPALQHLFTPDGWSWETRSPKVISLLKRIRAELCEIFGEGSFFHLGFDESHIHSAGFVDKKEISSYMAETVRTVESEGRRAIIWGDMLLCAAEAGCAGDKYFYECRETTPEGAQAMRSELPKSTVIADWHYEVLEAPVKTSPFFKNLGFEVIGCPWYKRQNIAAHIETVQRENLMGAMLTTWHTTPGNYNSLYVFAEACGAPMPDWCKYALRTVTATLLRKIMPLPESCEAAGFTDGQEIVEVIV